MRSNTLQLFVTMWNTYKINIKLKYTAEVPVLDFNPSEIAIRFCFISYPYNRTITISNKSDLPGYFYIIPPVSFILVHQLTNQSPIFFSQTLPSV